MLEYLQNPIWIIEALAVSAMFSFTYFLALKKRWAWYLYLIFCVGMLIVFTQKESWITVMNQFATMFLAIRNIVIWDWSEAKRKKALLADYAIIPWFVASVIIFWPGAVINAWWEVFMWVFIITKQVSWGRKSRGGWWILIGQHIFATGFNIVSGTFVLLIRPVVEITLAVYGLRKWK
jgi:hypothetical protein